MGNTVYAALAFLQYDRVYGCERYLKSAVGLMEWVLEECTPAVGPGFISGYEGWPENGPETTYPGTYKSIEHNIDAYAALMYRMLGEDEKAASALDALVSIQQEDGKFPAATTDHLSTGFMLFTGDPWEYGTAPHIAPTAWFVMAVNNFNPYAFAD